MRESRPSAASRVLAILASGAFLAVMVLVLVLLVFVNDGATYGADPAETSASFPLPSALSVALGCLVALALACLTLCASLLRRHAVLSDRAFLAVMAGVSGLVLVAQIVLVRSLYGVPGWDAGTILEYARWKASGLDAAAYYGGDVNAWVVGYLDLYPNNALLTWVLTDCYRLGGLIGVDGIYLACLLGALCVNVGGLLSCLLAARVTGSRTVAVAAFALYTLLFSLSPWVSVPYSDAYATLFVAATLCAGARALDAVEDAGSSRGRLAVRWLAVGVLAFLGYLIKPTVLLVLMALAVVALVRLVGWPDSLREKLARAGVAAAGLALAAGLVLGIVSPVVRASMGAGGDPAASLGLSHFFMMGQNDETTGSYLQSDVDASRSVADPAERSRAEWAAAFGRIASRGVSGNLDFYARKALYSFGDGTFSWAGEAGDGFLQATLPTWGPLSEGLRSLLYRAAWQGGADRGAFRMLAQIAWCATLALAAAGGASCLRAALASRRRRPDAAFDAAGHPPVSGARAAGACSAVSLAACDSGAPCGACSAASTHACDSGSRMPSPSVSPVVLVAALAVLGLFLYLLLFECRARYLYCFGPAMTLCAAVGLHAATCRLLTLPVLRRRP